jgi:3-oxoacyl-[acyl-carrier protein] reductase
VTELLDGRAAVVTGGASGIGLEIARAFGEQGAYVVIADYDGDAADAAASGLLADGLAAVAARCDVRVPDEIDAAVQRCLDEFGRLDVMVNNAGITRDATMRKMTLDDFEAVLDVHVKGTWLGTRAAAAVMREHKRGAIVNISSISGKIGLPGQTNYSAAKAGIVGLTKAAAKELAYLGVRVNAVQPGLIRTPMTASLRPDILAAKKAEVPMGRFGEAREVANVVVFLASDLSSYMTGAVLEIAGGRHM